MSMGEKIKQLRNQLRMTQGELAERIKVSQTHLSQVEKGVKGLSSEKLTLMASTLNTSVGYLLGETDNPAPMFRWNEEHTGRNKERGATGTNNGQPDQSTESQYKHKATHDLDKLVENLSSYNPDLPVHYRQLLVTWDEVPDSLRKQIAEGINYVLSLAENNANKQIVAKKDFENKEENPDDS